MSLTFTWAQEQKVWGQKLLPKAGLESLNHLLKQRLAKLSQGVSVFRKPRWCVLQHSVDQGSAGRWLFLQTEKKTSLLAVHQQIQILEHHNGWSSCQKRNTIYRVGNSRFCCVAISTTVWANPQCWDMMTVHWLWSCTANYASWDFSFVVDIPVSKFLSLLPFFPLLLCLLWQQQVFFLRDLFCPLHQKGGLSFPDAKLNA